MGGVRRSIEGGSYVEVHLRYRSNDSCNHLISSAIDRLGVADGHRTGGATTNCTQISGLQCSRCIADRDRLAAKPTDGGAVGCIGRFHIKQEATQGVHGRRIDRAAGLAVEGIEIRCRQRGVADRDGLCAQAADPAAVVSGEGIRGGSRQRCQRGSIQRNRRLAI